MNALAVGQAESPTLKRRKSACPGYFGAPCNGALFSVKYTE
jgi:hypothetical protein